MSWEEAAGGSRRSSHGLLARGVGRGDAVAVLARTRLEWILLDWAIMTIGAVVVGHLSDEHRHRVRVHPRALGGGARVCRRRGAAREARSVQQPSCRRCARSSRFDELPALEAEGRAHAAAYPDALDTPRARSRKTISRRSSTPRARPGRRRAACSRTRTSSPQRCACARIEDGGDTVLLFLPLAHSFGAARPPGGRVLRLDASRSSPTPRGSPRRSAPSGRRSFPRCRASTRRSMRACSTEIERGRRRKRSIGRWALGVGARASRLRRAGRAGAALLAAPGADRRQARLREGQRAARRPPARSASPAPRRSASTCSSSSTRSGCS